MLVRPQAGNIPRNGALSLRTRSNKGHQALLRSPPESLVLGHMRERKEPQTSMAEVFSNLGGLKIKAFSRWHFFFYCARVLWNTHACYTGQFIKPS